MPATIHVRMPLVKPPKPVRSRARQADEERVRALSAEIRDLQEQIASLAAQRQETMKRLRTEHKVVLRDLARLSGLSVQTVKVQTD